MTKLVSSPNRADAPPGPPRPMLLLVTGGGGVLGRALLPLARAAGHTVLAPRHAELDLFDRDAVRRAVRGADGVLHLATRIRGLDELDRPEAWSENDRLRAEASAILVEAARATTTSVYVQPSVTFVYPPDAPADEETPIGEVSPILASALVAERNALAFTGDGHRGGAVRLRLVGGRGSGH